MGKRKGKVAGLRWDCVAMVEAVGGDEAGGGGGGGDGEELGVGGFIRWMSTRLFEGLGH